MKQILISLSAILSLTGCSKSNSDSSQGPGITISSPSNNQNFTAGQTVTVAAVVIDQDKIQKTQIHVSNKSSGADVLHVEDHPATVSANVSGSFVAQAGVTYKIEVEAVDMMGNESEQEIEVKGN